MNASIPRAVGFAGTARRLGVLLAPDREPAWSTAAVPDFLDPRTDGVRPPDLANTLNFSAATFKLAVEDPAVHQVLIEVQHLLKPGSALREPALVERVNAEMAASRAAAT